MLRRSGRCRDESSTLDGRLVNWSASLRFVRLHHSNASRNFRIILAISCSCSSVASTSNFSNVCLLLEIFRPCSECISCRSVDVYACHGAEVFRLFHFVKAMEARMLNCPRKFGLTFFIDCMVMLCVRAFQNCIIANISTRFAALSHPRQLAFKFQRSLQLAIDRFCHGLLSSLQLEFHSILLLVWLSYLQLDFNRSCHWCAQLFTAWFQSLLLSDWLSILQLDIIRSWRNWVGLIFCSLLSIDLVTGLVKFSAARIRSILPQFTQFLAAGLISVDLITDIVQLSAVWLQSNLLLPWFNSLQLPFKRYCHWLTQFSVACFQSTLSLVCSWSSL